MEDHGAERRRESSPVVFDGELEPSGPRRMASQAHANATVLRTMSDRVLDEASHESDEVCFVTEYANARDVVVNVTFDEAPAGLELDGGPHDVGDPDGCRVAAG